MQQKNNHMDKKMNGKLLSDRNFRLILTVSLMSVMSVASISPAFPEIARALQISGQEVGLLITVFTLPGLVLTPILGVLADNYGRKKILVPSLLLFGAAGGMCGFVRDFELLLVFRFIQGMGVAALGVLNITIISDLYSGNKLSRAMGYNSAMVSIGAAFYPVIGGLMATAGWYYPFFLAFLGVPAGLLVLFYLDNPEPMGNKSIIEYLKNAFRNILNWQIIAVFLNSFLTFFILFGMLLLYFPIFLEETFTISSFEIGLIMSFLAIVTAFCSTQLGRLSNICSKKVLLIIAFSLYAVSLCIIPFFTNIWMLLIPVFLFGIGHGLNIPTLITILAGLSSDEHRAVTMAVAGMVLRMGQTMGPLLMGLVFITLGISWTFFAAAFLSVIMIIIVTLTK